VTVEKLNVRLVDPECRRFEAAEWTGRADVEPHLGRARFFGAQSLLTAAFEADSRSGPEALLVSKHPTFS
jgi:hypothetical protein